MSIEFTASGSGYYRVFKNNVEISKHVAEREALEKMIQLKKESNPTDIITMTHDYLVSITGEVDKAIELTAQGSGYYKLYNDDEVISNHTTEREAVERLFNLKEEDPDGKYSIVHDYFVDSNIKEDEETLPPPEEIITNPYVDKMQIGVNLAQNAYWEPVWLFKNWIKTTGEMTAAKIDAIWEENTTNPEIKISEDGKLLLDEDQVASFYIARSWAGPTKDYIPPERFYDDGAVKGYHPTGNYVFRWKGTGEFKFLGDNQLNDVLDEENKTITFSIDRPTNAGMSVIVLSSDPNDPVYDMELLEEQFANEDTSNMTEWEKYANDFHPAFIADTKQFSVLRFMDMQNINHNKASQWSQRTTPKEPSQGMKGYGVSIEYLIALANRTQSDPWFCVPHLADEDYIRNMTEMIRDNLDASLTPYYEYSNEVWNGGFSQARWAVSKGQSELGYENYNDAIDGWYLKKSLEMFAIIEDVYGSKKNNIIRVLSNQNANPWKINNMLETLAMNPDISGEPVNGKFDILAVAPYFPSGRQYVDFENTSIDDMFDLMKASLDIVIDDDFAKISEIAKKFDARLATYEGGQHLTTPIDQHPNAAQYTEFFYKINQSPKMYDLYREYLDRLAYHGCELYMQFQLTSRWTRHGAWGAKNLMHVLENEDMPKYRALIDFITG